MLLLKQTEDLGSVKQHHIPPTEAKNEKKIFK